MPGSNRNSLRLAPLALLALLALVVALVVPAGAVAQEPSVEQYLATTPDAGGATSGSDESSGNGSTPPGTGASEAQNKAQRDLANIAASAEQSREDAGRADAAPATELLRSDSGGGPGMGIFLWIVIGGTLAWAIGSGVIRNRQGGQTA